MEKTEVTLSTELFYAPEMMYQSLDLPAMIKEASRDLEADYVKEVFSNILVTGGNSDLKGFSQRLSVDLRDAMPEYSMIINVYPFTQLGSPSWDAVMGAHSVSEEEVEIDEEIVGAGVPFWMTREEYITFGTHKLLSDNQLQD